MGRGGERESGRGGERESGRGRARNWLIKKSKFGGDSQNLGDLYHPLHLTLSMAVAFGSGCFFDKTFLTIVEYEKRGENTSNGTGIFGDVHLLERGKNPIDRCTIN